MSEDLIGSKFGNWEVIDFAESRLIGNGKGKKVLKRYWKCKCNCGLCENLIKDVSEKNLKSSRSKSCGRESKLRKGKNRKYNTYNLEGEYGIGYTNTNEEFYFDLEDYHKIEPYFWYLHFDGTNYYMRAYKETVNNKPIFIFIHNIIMENDLEEGMIADHIDGKTLDNRKSTMRICRGIDNTKNLKIYSNNKSGHKGVCYSEREGKWKSYIYCEKKKINLGTHNNIIDAIEIREKAEIKYFGEFNRDVKTYEI